MVLEINRYTCIYTYIAIVVVIIFAEIIKSIFERQRLYVAAEAKINNECENVDMQEFLSHIFCVGQRYEATL